MAVEVADLVAYLRADTAQYDASMKASAAAAESTGNKIGSAFKGVQMAFGAMGVAAAAAIVESIKEASKYQTLLVEIQSNTGMTNKELAAMSDGIKNMAMNTGANLDDLAKAFMNIHNSGFNAADSMKILKPAMESALSTGDSVASVADALSIGMHEFGLSANKATQYMNVFHLAAQEGHSTLGQFADGTVKAMNLAGSFGQKLDQVAAGLSTLTQSGQSARQASNGLSAVFSGMAKPTVAASQMIAALSKATGIDLVHDFSVAGLRTKGYVGVLGDAKKAIAEVTGNQQMQNAILSAYGAQLLRGHTSQATYAADMAKMKRELHDGNQAWLALFPNINAARAAMMLGGNQAKSFNQHLHDMADAMSGKVDPTIKGFAAQQASLAAQQAKLGETVRVLSIDLGTVFLPIVTRLVASVTPYIQLAAKWVEAHQQLSAKLLGTVAVVGTLVGGLSVLSLALGPIVGLIGGLTLPIVGLIGAGILLYNAWTHDWGGIQEKTKAAAAVLTPIFTNLKSIVIAVFDTFTGQTKAAQAIVSRLPGPWREAFATIITTMKQAQQFVTQVVTEIATFMKGAWGGIAQELRGVWTIIKGTVQGGLQFLTNDIKFWIDLFHGNWRGAWNDAINMLKGLGTIGKAVLQGGLDILEGTIKAWIGGLGALLGDAGKKAIGGFVHGIATSIPGVQGVLQGITSHLPSWKGPPSKDVRLLEPAGTLLMQGLMNGIRNQIAELQHVLSGVGTNIGQQVAVGIESSIPRVVAAIQKMMQAANGALAAAKVAVPAVALAGAVATGGGAASASSSLPQQAQQFVTTMTTGMTKAQALLNARTQYELQLGQLANKDALDYNKMEADKTRLAAQYAQQRINIDAQYAAAAKATRAQAEAQRKAEAAAAKRDREAEAAALKAQHAATAKTLLQADAQVARSKEQELINESQGMTKLAALKQGILIAEAARTAEIAQVKAQDYGNELKQAKDLGAVNLLYMRVIADARKHVTAEEQREIAATKAAHAKAHAEHLAQIAQAKAARAAAHAAHMAQIAQAKAARAAAHAAHMVQIAQARAARTAAHALAMAQLAARRAAATAHHNLLLQQQAARKAAATAAHVLRMQQIAQAKAARTEAHNAHMAQIAQAKAARAEAAAQAAAIRKQEQDTRIANAARIAQIRQQEQQLALQRAAQNAQLAQQAHQQHLQYLQQEEQITLTYHQQHMLYIQQEQAASASKNKAEVASIKQADAALKAKYDQELAALKQADQQSAANFANQKTNISQTDTASKARYQTEISNIQQVSQANTAMYQGMIAAAKSGTPGAAGGASGGGGGGLNSIGTVNGYPGVGISTTTSLGNPSYNGAAAAMAAAAAANNASGGGVIAAPGSILAMERLGLLGTGPISSAAGAVSPVTTPSYPGAGSTGGGGTNVSIVIQQGGVVVNGASNNTLGQQLGQALHQTVIETLAQSQKISTTGASSRQAGALAS